jgi:hypothetical protein
MTLRLADEEDSQQQTCQSKYHAEQEWLRA